MGIANASPDVSLDLGSNTDSIHVPVGTTAQRPASPAAGYFRYNSTTGGFEGYTTEWGAIAGSGDSGGSSSSFARDEFTGDGSTTAFTLSKSIASNNEDRLIIFNEGVFQRQDSYTLSGTTLTFDTAPANGNKIVAYIMEVGVVGADPTIDTMTGDGSDTTLALSVTPSHENATFVTIDGVFQHKDTYSVSGSTLTFSAAPPNGSAVECTTFTTTTLTNVAIVQDADQDTKIQVEESSDEDKIRFDTGGSQRMVISGDNVGIGTDSPNAYSNVTTLTINGSTQGRLDLEYGGTHGASLLALSGETQVKAVGSSQVMTFEVNNAERMRIDTSGNVGIGATTVDEKIHVEVSSGDAAIKLEDASGDYVRIDQNSVGANDKIRFKSGSSLSERMRILADGHVILNGTTNQANGSCSFQYSGSDSVTISNNTTTAKGHGHEYQTFRRAGTQIGSIYMNGTSNVGYSTSSDHRLKENVVDLDNAITRVNQLQPRRFNFITDADRTFDGFLAHEAQSVVPEAVTGTHNETRTISNVVFDVDGNVIDKDITEDVWTAGKTGDEAVYPSDSTWSASHTENVYQGIDQAKLVPLLTAALQEAITKIEALETRIETLENE